MTNATTTTENNFSVGKLTKLVEELERRKGTMLDSVIDSRQMIVGEGSEYLNLCPVPGTQAMEFLPEAGVPMRKHALWQMGQKVDPSVPGKFLCDIAKQHPDLASQMLEGLSNRAARRYFIRQLDGEVRAVLGDRYRVIDNYDMVFQALETSKEVNAKVVSCSLSDDQMRIKLIAPDLWSVLDSAGTHRHTFFKPGDLGNPEWHTKNGIREELIGPGTTFEGNRIWPGCEISNSETGKGGASVRFFITDSACFNMMTLDTMQRTVHLGGKMEVGIYSDETRSSESQTIMLKMRDAIKSCFTPEVFEKIIDLRRKAQEDRIEAPTMAVDNVVNHFNLSQEKRDQLLECFVKDYAPTRDGLSQAVSRLAQEEFSDADKSSDYEAMAGQILEKPALVRA